VIKAKAGMSSNSSPQEEVLVGGRLTGDIVKIGDTVRRPWKASSGVMAVLLEHLVARGFDGAPRYLGRDEVGRACLSYLPGEVPGKWMSTQSFEAQQAFGQQVLRQFGGL
jgi:hypothetical protein